MAPNDTGPGNKSTSSASALNDPATETVTRAVLQVDKQKVEDCQNDIDTLLLVAGLFSAVLTPLLVESYHTLRRDPTEVMIFLFQRLLQQTDSFTIGNNFLNATTSSPRDTQPLEFTPTANAKRVNILWFASLTLSLATASFCITVKQWLRDYLLEEHISPLPRLRIRNFRYHALVRWRVFEIAATLPLLLQAALAFFLVGLCYFTADVHEEVGHTTLPLVAAWGACFVASVLMPICWKTCPYKTPFSKAFHIVAGRSNRGSDEDKAAHNETSDTVSFSELDESHRDDQFLFGPMWTALLSTPREPDDLIKFVVSAIHRRLSQGTTEKTIPLDLRDLRDTTYNDFMQMVIDIIKTEFNQRHKFQKLAGDWEAQYSWLKSCLLLLLFSESKNESSLIPASANQVLRTCLTRKWRPLFLDVIRSQVSTAPGQNETTPIPLFVLQRLQGGLALVDTTPDLLNILGDLFPPPASSSNLPSADNSPHQGALTRARMRPYEFISAIPPEHKLVVLAVLVERATRLAGEPGPWKMEDRDTLVHVFRLYPSARDCPELDQQRLADLVMALLLSSAEPHTNIVYSIILERDPDQAETVDSKRVRDTAGEYYREAFWGAGTLMSERLQILYRFLVWTGDANVIPDGDQYVEYAFQTKQRMVASRRRIDLLNSCLFFLQLLLPDLPKDRLDQINQEFSQYKPLWKSIFMFLDLRFRDAELQVPTHCLILIKTSRQMGRAYEDLFPNRFIAALEAYESQQGSPDQRDTGNSSKRDDTETGGEELQDTSNKTDDVDSALLPSTLALVASNVMKLATNMNKALYRVPSPRTSFESFRKSPESYRSRRRMSNSSLVTVPSIPATLDSHPDTTAVSQAERATMAEAYHSHNSESAAASTSSVLAVPSARNSLIISGRPEVKVIGDTSPQDQDPSSSRPSSVHCSPLVASGNPPNREDKLGLSPHTHSLHTARHASGLNANIVQDEPTVEAITPTTNTSGLSTGYMQQGAASTHAIDTSEPHEPTSNTQSESATILPTIHERSGVNSNNDAADPEGINSTTVMPMDEPEGDHPRFNPGVQATTKES